MAVRYDETAATEHLSDYVGVLATSGVSFGSDPVLLRTGQDHDIVRVGTRAVYRFPRHQRALDTLDREVAALGRLSALAIGVLLPEVTDATHIEALLGRAYVAQRYLVGEPLRQTSVEAVGALAYRYAVELARVLQAMATVDVDADLVQVLDRAPITHSWAELAAGVRERLLPLMSQDGRRRAEGELERVLAVEPPQTSCLVHGDFGGTNLRWDADETQLTGVLDWAQAHVGDPAYDLASVGATLGWPLAGVVDDVLESEDPARLERARAYAGTFGLQEAWHSVTTGDDLALEGGLLAYR